MEGNFQIVRIEHSDGFGMLRYPEPKVESRYTAGDSEETWYLLKRHLRLPTPYREGIIDNFYEDKSLFCSFISMEKFNELCKPEEVKFLLTKDFKVLLLEVSSILKGSYQCMFRKEDIISSQDISSLFL